MNTIWNARSRLVVLLLFLTVAMVATLQPGGATAGAGVKMGMIMPGPIQDADFNMLGYVALQEVHKRLGIAVSHSEQVAVADAERVAREYLGSGHTIIAFHGAQYLTHVQRLASQFPNANFIIVSQGRNLPPNVWNITRKFHEGFYPLGALAARVTKSNRIGYISGIRLPDFIASLNASYEAVKQHNPKAQYVYAFVGDQNDPVKARQTAEAQIAGGVDVIISSLNLGIFGVVEAAQAARTPVYLTSFYTDKASMAPKHFLTSLVLNFSRPYVDIVEYISKGKPGGNYDMRPGSGMELAPLMNASPEAVRAVQALFQEVVQGKPVPEILDKIVVP
jgi:basic membrane lipoprotein Med (substrate-binding protein (PBP1-ABC) superfamily)